MQLIVHSGPSLVLVALGVAALVAAAGSAVRRLRAANASGATSTYSAGERVGAAVAAWILVFGVLAVAEFGRSRGAWRWGVLGAATLTAGVALWVLWERFATCLIIDDVGFRAVGPMFVRHGVWADLQDARWDGRRERLVLRFRTGTITLRGSLRGIQQVVSKASERLNQRL